MAKSKTPARRAAAGKRSSPKEGQNRPRGCQIREELFALEYTKDFNGAAAMRRAGFSKGNAGEAAAKLLKRESVQLLINDEVNRRKENILADNDRVQKEIEYIAMSDVRELFDEKGLIRPIHQWPEPIARAVARVEMYLGQVAKVRLWDKGSALALLARIKGMDRAGDGGLGDETLTLRWLSDDDE